MAQHADIENWLSMIGSEARFGKHLRQSAARLLLFLTEQKLSVVHYRLDEPGLRKEQGRPAVHEDNAHEPAASMLH